MSELHLVCGLPGSGKSTLARILENECRALRLTPDEWLSKLAFDGHDAEARAAVESLQGEMTEKLLRLGVNVILEWGFWRRAERDRWRSAATAIGATTRLHYCEATRAELIRRLARRSETDSTAIRVEVAALDGWIEAFEAPTADELEQPPWPGL